MKKASKKTVNVKKSARRMDLGNVEKNHFTYQFTTTHSLFYSLHAMNISITHANQNDKQISKSIEKFFKRFHISSALKASNAYKKKAFPLLGFFSIFFC